MKWSIDFGHLFGIRFRVHLTFLILVLFFGLVGALAGGLLTALSAMLFLCMVFACVTIHELAHSLVARAYGVPVDSITLLPIGGVASMRGMPETPGQEIVISVVGPAISIAIFIFMFPFLRLAGADFWPVDPFTANPIHFLASLASVNLLLGVFNFIPAFPMDGGRIFRGVLALLFDYGVATRIATVLGQIFAVGFVLVGFLPDHFWFIIIGLFIFFGASAEQRQSRVHSALKRFTVSQAMLSSFHVLPPDVPVSAAAEALLHGGQADFPIVHQGRFLGILSSHDIVDAMRSGQSQRPVGELVSPNLPAVTPDMNLDQVQRLMILGNHMALPVTSGGLLAGIISQERMGRFLAVHRML